MLVDSHAHLNFKAFDEDRAEVMARCQQAGMTVINVGAALATSRKAVELADGKNFFASVGLHPIHVFDEEFEVFKWQNLLDNSVGKIVAIGETGFDYFHMDLSFSKGATSVSVIKDKQKQIFSHHLDLAKKNKLPVIVHGRNGEGERDAYHDIYELLKLTGQDRGVAHCFGGNLSEAKQIINLGFHLGFTGIVTFDKTGLLEEIAKWAPLDRILIETDCPWLTPAPFRGKRNEPPYVQYVAEKIAEIKGKTKEEIIETTGNNAKKLFNIK